MDDIEKKINRNKVLIITMVIFALIGISLLSYDFIMSKIRLTFETVNLEFYGNNEPKEINKEPTQEKNKEPETNNSEKKEPTLINGKYFGYIQIPKINLNQGLVPLNSANNDVDRNIQTIYPSDMPDVKNGNLILAAHSGTSSISYFKHLYQLTNNDEIYILYDSIKYIYKIVNIYTVPKTGQVEIKRSSTKTVVTLITCTKNDNTTQTVYIGELIRKEGV
ncbi:MAG: sortase [Bacilli bacterium]|nr:sortase [Bacilli bacterium]